jgi:hypothetical protein
VGLRLTAEEVGKGILAREQIGEKIAHAVLDPSAFAQDGGPSIAERLAKVGARFTPADNTRVARRGAISGWDQVRGRLKGDADGPMLVVFSTCTDTIRTLPALQHDPLKAEDLDTEGEDHAADEVRYACLSRPWIPRKTITEPGKVLTVGPITGPNKNPSMNDLWKIRDRERRRI